MKRSKAKTPRIWAMFAMAEFITVALCLVQSWRSYKLMRRDGWAKRSPIITVVFRDNLLYFFMFVYLLHVIGFDYSLTTCQGFRRLCRWISPARVPDREYIL